VDETGAYYTEWSKPERKTPIQYTNAYIWQRVFCLGFPLWSRPVVSDSCNPMDCSLPGFSVHGIFQARILEWVAISFSKFYSTQSYIRSLNHFEFIFVYGIGECSNFIHFQVPSFPSTIYQRSCIFLHSCLLFHRLIDHRYMEISVWKLQFFLFNIGKNSFVLLSYA